MEKHLVRAFLLQHPRVECDGKPLNIRLKKAQALLFYLLVQKKATRDLLYVCQELCRRSILTEVYDGGALSLAFAQVEFRELTYSRIPALNRRILHLNIAQALTDLSPASVPDLDALTAYHYDQGGRQVPRHAV